MINEKEYELLKQSYLLLSCALILIAVALSLDWVFDILEPLKPLRYYIPIDFALHMAIATITTFWLVTVTAFLVGGYISYRRKKRSQKGDKIE